MELTQNDLKKIWEVFKEVDHGQITFIINNGIQVIEADIKQHIKIWLDKKYG
jgi:hypothetical protein